MSWNARFVQGLSTLVRGVKEWSGSEGRWVRWRVCFVDHPNKKVKNKQGSQRMMWGLRNDYHDEKKSGKKERSENDLAQKAGEDSHYHSTITQQELVFCWSTTNLNWSKGKTNQIVFTNSCETVQNKEIRVPPVKKVLILFAFSCSFSHM